MTETVPSAVARSARGGTAHLEVPRIDAPLVIALLEATDAQGLPAHL